MNQTATLNHPNLKIRPIHCLVSPKISPSSKFSKNQRIFLFDHSLILRGSQVKLCRHWGLNFHKFSLVQTLYLSFWRLYYCLIYESNVARSAKSWCLNKKQLTLRKDPSCTMKNNSSICFLMIIISKIIVQICSVCKAYLIKYHHVVFHKMLT